MVNYQILCVSLDIGCINQALNKFDKTLCFTVDKFDDVVPHFFDLELRDDGIALHTKQTNTSSYVNYNSNGPWAFGASWIKSITTRAKNICLLVYGKSELEIMKRYAS